MLPEVYKTSSDNSALTIEFHYFFETFPEKLWKILVSHHPLDEWVPSLAYLKLEVGGLIDVSTPTSNFKEEILAVDPPAQLYFTWRKGWIRLRLIPTPMNQSRLHFSLWTPQLKEETVTEVSHWIINMEMIEAQLAGLPLMDRQERFTAISPIVNKELLKTPEQL